MFNKLEKNAIAAGLKRRQLEHSEYCNECLQDTDIRDLNLVSGVCTRCKPNLIKLDKQTIEKLLRLADD